MRKCHLIPKLKPRGARNCCGHTINDSTVDMYKQFVQLIIREM